MTTKEEILNIVTEYYLKSHDFNGISIIEFLKNVRGELEELIKLLTPLVQDGEISLNFGDIHPNSHVKALKEEPRELQLKKLQQLVEYDLHHVCVYPTTEHMKSIVNPSDYQDRPFDLHLALAEPQLSFLSFDLSVLEVYRNDPRYYYTNDDVSGTIYICSEHKKEISEIDQMFLNTFGISYDTSNRRAVAVFLRDLSHMTPKHQRIWNEKLLEGDYKLHPDYYNANILGSWDLGVSIFDAFLNEIRHINAMCRLIGRPLLFRNEAREGERPKKFGFIIRPTLGEFNDFVHLLDKLISESINHEFFLNEVPFEFDEPRKDGKIIVHQKGSIQILEEWLAQHYKLDDRKPIVEMIDNFKEIRKLRQRPAHSIQEDVFDQKYLDKQREVITKAYTAMLTLRLIFASHPKARGYKTPEYLDSRPIWIQ